MYSSNPLPEVQLLIEELPIEQQREGLWLAEILLAGKIPSRVPNFNSTGLRAIATSFRMWAYIHHQMVKHLARAMAYEFGPYATYLEVMAGGGWLAKGLYDSYLTGIYIATDIRPPEDPVYPVYEIPSVEAIIKHRDSIDAFVISWPLKDDRVMHEIIEYIPVGAKIIYLGEPRGHNCASEEFFDRTEMVSTKVRQWDLARRNYFSWNKTHDSIYLLEKTH